MGKKDRIRREKGAKEKIRAERKAEIRALEAAARRQKEEEKAQEQAVLDKKNIREVGRLNAPPPKDRP